MASRNWEIWNWAGQCYAGITVAGVMAKFHLDMGQAHSALSGLVMRKNMIANTTLSRDGQKRRHYVATVKEPQHRERVALKVRAAYRSLKKQVAPSAADNALATAPLVRLK